MTTKNTKAMQQALDMRFIAAFTKYFAAKNATITVDGEVYTPEQVTATLQPRVDKQANVETARGQYAQAVAAAKAEVAQTKAFYDGSKQLVLVMYASSPGILSEFGLAPKKKTGPKSVATKQAAITLGKATRIARHTMGPKQKQQIKGVVSDASTGATATAPGVAPNGVTGH